jgi:hypothetical protein
MPRLLKAVRSVQRLTRMFLIAYPIMDNLLAALKSVTMYKIGTVLALLFKLLQAFQCIPIWKD